METLNPSNNQLVKLNPSYSLLSTRDHCLSAHTLESLAFPPEEAERLENFEKRQLQAPELFFGAWLDGTLAGFISGARSNAPLYSKASMFDSTPAGEFVDIHSVVSRVRGLGRPMLLEYVALLAKIDGLVAVRLLCHEHLIKCFDCGPDASVSSFALASNTRPLAGNTHTTPPTASPATATSAVPLAQPTEPDERLTGTRLDANPAQAERPAEQQEVGAVNIPMMAQTARLTLGALAGEQIRTQAPQIDGDEVNALQVEV
ncbi:hypothetical protein MNV49_004239 [Pseudohyphozyma bogoriensis]|nr:hypothetical protein MNV49_004239 [Pseudohyphozyma bogoriensis]